MKFRLAITAELERIPEDNWQEIDQFLSRFMDQIIYHIVGKREADTIVMNISRSFGDVPKEKDVFIP